MNMYKISTTVYVSVFIGKGKQKRNLERRGGGWGRENERKMKEGERRKTEGEMCRVEERERKSQQ